MIVRAISRFTGPSSFTEWFSQYSITTTDGSDGMRTEKLVSTSKTSVQSSQSHEQTTLCLHFQNSPSELNLGSAKRQIAIVSSFVPSAVFHQNLRNEKFSLVSKTVQLQANNESNRHLNKIISSICEHTVSNLWVILFDFGPNFINIPMLLLWVSLTESARRCVWWRSYSRL